MIQVQVEISDGADLVTVVVRTTSIQRSLDLIRQRYPEGETRVVFPLDPQSFFVADLPGSTEEFVSMRTLDGAPAPS